MNDVDHARHLTARNYAKCVRRVRSAIRGEMSVSTSQGEPAPSQPQGTVVGLCGQGGRHPYFTIPLSILEAALDRIENANRDNALEEIAAACRDLRQQTYFDTGTGCVNDRLPSMVPLLPPSEIWLDGCELPLDVWRLLGFEYDLVSSAMASRVAVEDFAFSAVTQSGLAFRILLNEIGTQRTRFHFELRNLPPAWASAVPLSDSIEASMARVFFEAGSLLTPLAQDFTKWYAAIRYAHWVDRTSSDLRVLDDFNRDSVDCRYRGLFAEEVGIGLMAIVLSDVFGASPISNTVEVLPPSPTSAGGPVADFIAQCVNPGSGRKTSIVAESKGSLGQAVSKERRDRAKQQVSQTSVAIAGYDEILPLALYSRICFAGQKKVRTHVLVDDPESDFQNQRIRIDPLTTWRVAYAKSLRFIGMETAAEQVLRGDAAEAVRPMDFDRNRDRIRGERDEQRLRRAAVARQRFGFDLVLDAGRYAVGSTPECCGSCTTA